jgi:hypothetical protein
VYRVKKIGMTRNEMLNTTSIEYPSRKILKSESSAINKKGAENPLARKIPTMTGPMSGSFELM